MKTRPPQKQSFKLLMKTFLMTGGYLCLFVVVIAAIIKFRSPEGVGFFQAVFGKLETFEAPKPLDPVPYEWCPPKTSSIQSLETSTSLQDPEAILRICKASSEPFEVTETNDFAPAVEALGPSGEKAILWRSKEHRGLFQIEDLTFRSQILDENLAKAGFF